MGAPDRAILVVDDDADIREALGQILSDEGYRVLCAANGQEALTLLRGDGAPALILLDLMMPVMNGWQFRSEQLQDTALASIPVVIISADRNVQQKASTITADGYLQKPIQLDDLLQTIARFVG